MPHLVPGGPDGVSSESRWLPTTAVGQMGATLASWLGVGGTDLRTVFPHLANFSRADLGYFG